MPTRRTFLSLCALVGTAGLTESTAHAATRRFRRRSFFGTRCGSVSEPSTASKNEAEFIQPDYGKWQQVKIGMHRDDVLRLLGEPLHRQDADPTVSSYLWEFGHLEFAHPAIPSGGFGFLISFEFSTHRVDEVWDPFDGQLSNDGVPTVPRLVLPHDDSQWNHFPRFLDLRWQPSSGRYPIRYEIEVSVGQDVWEGSDVVSVEYVALPSRTSDVPHHTISFVGKQEGRWRVRAENRLGQSEWSEFHHFEFTV